MPLYIGENNKFIVKRETDISYTLTPDDENLTTYVFLHFNQSTKRLHEGEKITAFLYFDQKKRLCATMEEPMITTTNPGFVSVVDVKNWGVYLNIGIVKDILLSADYLPKNQLAWPKIGDLVPCILVPKTDQLVARIVTKQDIIEPKNLQAGEHVDATVIKITVDGLTVITNDFDYIFIHSSLIRKKYSIGEVINVKIININNNNEYNGSLIEQKELSRIDDAQIILGYLNKFGGVLKLGNLSTPEEIKKEINMSKSAFKRAVGALYKQKLITIEDQYIRLI